MRYCRCLAVTVNVTPGGGSNALHGAVYDYKRWAALNAKSWSDNRLGLPKPPVSYNQFGAVADLTREARVPPPPSLDELRGPRGFGRNLALSKNLKLYESVRLQIRAEAANFTNTPSRGNPGTTMSTPATFGVINSGGGGRSMQMSARGTF